MSTKTVLDGARQGAESAADITRRLELISDDATAVTIFSKFMKKANDAAQSAM